MSRNTEIVHSNEEEHHDIESELAKALRHATLRPDSAGNDNNVIVEGLIKSNDKSNSEDKPKPAAEYLHDVIDEMAFKEIEMSMKPEELAANKEKAKSLKLELDKYNACKQAIDLYTYILEIYPIAYSKERAALYGNRAAAKTKIDLKKSALEDYSKAIELWPEYAWVLLRRAKLHEHENRLDEALSDYKRVYELEPGQHEAGEAMMRLRAVMQERNVASNEGNAGQFKIFGQFDIKPHCFFQKQQDRNTGSNSMNFNPNPS